MVAQPHICWKFDRKREESVAKCEEEKLTAKYEKDKLDSRINRREEMK